MRPEHSETKAKTETKGARPRPKTTRPRPVQSCQLHVKVTQIGSLCFIFYYTHEVND